MANKEDKWHARQRYIDIRLAIEHNRAIDNIRRSAKAGSMKLSEDFGDRNPCALRQRVSENKEQAKMDAILRAETFALSAIKDFPKYFDLKTEDLDWFKRQDPNDIFGPAESEPDTAISEDPRNDETESIASGLTEQSRANQFLEPRPTDAPTIGATLSRPLSPSTFVEVQERIASSRTGKQDTGKDGDSLYDI